jgi:hypothetical protein
MGPERKNPRRGGRRAGLRGAGTRLGRILPLLVSRFLACALAVVAVLAIVDRLYGVRDHVPQPPPPGRIVESESAPGGRCSHPDPAIVFLTASRLEAQTAILRLEVTLCVGDAFLRSLRTTGPERSRIWFGPGGDTQFRRRYADRHFIVTVYQSPSDRPLWTGKTMLRALSGDVYAPVAMTPPTLALPMLGQPDAYPLDTFVDDGLRLDIRLPRGVEVAPSSGNDAGSGELPVRVSFVTSPAVGEFEFEFRTLPQSYGSVDFHLGAQRGPSTKFFIGIVLLVPLLFVLLLAVAFRRRARTEGVSGLRDLFLGLIGVTLALLPLRQVLVPSELTGLTLVDWYLAAVILLCAALGLWWAPRAS